MSDDADLLFAAAATAAALTWVGSRTAERGRKAPHEPWVQALRAVREGLARCWRETPAYHLYTGLRDALSRKR
jgi:hypothetical protein